jgi:hypothetical protein
MNDVILFNFLLIILTLRVFISFEIEKILFKRRDNRE